MAVQVKVNVLPPLVPNFLKIKIGVDGKLPDQLISIADLSDEELKEVGKLWTQELVAKAGRVRKNRKNFAAEDSRERRR